MLTMSAVGPGAFEVFAEAVVRHASLHRHATRRHVGEAEGIVRLRIDRLGQVLADLIYVDVERRYEVDVADVIPAEDRVHQAGDLVARLRVLVELDALDER
jgi:hypothetical protein